LEKTSKIIESNHHPSTTVPDKPCPEVPHHQVYWTLLGMGSPPLPWAACANAWPLRHFPQRQILWWWKSCVAP